jgi:hypothetical protein
VKTARILSKAHRKQPMRAMEEQCATKIILLAQPPQHKKTQKVIVGSGASSSARPHVTPAATGYVKIHT